MSAWGIVDGNRVGRHIDGEGHLGKERRYIFQDYLLFVLVQMCKLRVFIDGVLQSVDEVIWQDASVGARRRLWLSVGTFLR